ncbi:nucleotide-binding protein [Candidatus Woesearchaeota archaeon]|nr:nucleotide-binding protein [Candidatus Woesearchaeota archaeon]
MTRQILIRLLSQGRQFLRSRPYQIGFSSGGIRSLSPDYIGWVAECEAFLESNFGKDSISFKTFQKGHQITIIEKPINYFENAHSYFLGAIIAALRAQEHPELSGVKNRKIKTNKIFVVHGQDHELKEELEGVLKEIGADPIILHKQPDEGKTIIEKIEKYKDVDYAIILLTPDDILFDSKQEVARQNVIFEFGYFMGCLGRGNVCCIRKQNVSIPSDLDGLIYKKISVSLNEIRDELIGELSAAGLSLKI